MIPLLYLQKCGSTNDEVISYISEKITDFLAVYTRNQTNGRGQYGNSWVSAENKNLAYSFALKSEFIFNSDILFNFRTAIILRQFLANLTQSEVQIKWPNDIIINQKKISGILIEKKKVKNSIYYVVGIGINVLQTDFGTFSKASSLVNETSQNIDVDELVTSFHHYFLEKIVQRVSSEEVLELLNINLFRKNQISVFEIKGARQNGIIQNVDQEGFLWVELENEGLQKFFFKEIDLLY